MHSFITQVIVINNSNRTKDNKQFIHSFIHHSSKAIPLPFNLTSGLLKGSSRILMFQRFIRSFHFYNCKFEERTRNRLKCFIQLELMLFRFSYCSSQMNKIIVIRANFTHIYIYCIDFHLYSYFVKRRLALFEKMVYHDSFFQNTQATTCDRKFMMNNKSLNSNEGGEEWPLIGHFMPEASSMAIHVNKRNK